MRAPSNLEACVPRSSARPRQPRDFGRIPSHRTLTSAQENSTPAAAGLARSLANACALSSISAMSLSGMVTNLVATVGAPNGTVAISMPQPASAGATPACDGPAPASQLLRHGCQGGQAAGLAHLFDRERDERIHALASCVTWCPHRSSVYMPRRRSRPQAASLRGDVCPADERQRAELTGHRQQPRAINGGIRQRRACARRQASTRQPYGQPEYARPTRDRRTWGSGRRQTALVDRNSGMPARQERTCRDPVPAADSRQAGCPAGIR